MDFDIRDLIENLHDGIYFVDFERKIFSDLSRKEASAPRLKELGNWPSASVAAR